MERVERRIAVSLQQFTELSFLDSRHSVDMANSSPPDPASVVGRFLAARRGYTDAGSVQAKTKHEIFCCSSTVSGPPTRGRRCQNTHERLLDQ